jgi:hypothetical protein
MKIEQVIKMATQVQKTDVWWKVEKGKKSVPIVPLTDEEKKVRLERFEKAYDEAVNVIFSGVKEKVDIAEIDGKDQLIVYTFQFAKDKNATADENGVQVVFGEKVRLMDILVKGFYKFVLKAGSLLNKEGEKKYRVGYFKKPDGVWNIFVSWRTLEEKAVKKVYQKKDSVKPYKKYNKKKEGDGFMMETKLVKKVVEVKKPNPNSWAGKVVAGLA